MDLSLSHLITFAAALAGLLLTIYIHAKKKAPTPLVCPLGSNCASVLHSQFSKFLGVPVELLGMLYYVLMSVTYGGFIISDTLADSWVVYVAFLISLVAFLFSAYLVFIQAFTLRQWCTWCLCSAGLSSLIFVTAFTGLDHEIINFLQAYRPFLIGGHLFGLAVGLGAATLADIFFFKFLRDLKISHQEADILNTISQVVWLGLGILTFTGVGLFMTNPLGLIESDKFLLKVIVVSVIIINGAFLNLYIAPLLTRISFGGKHKHVPGELHRERKIAFALGGVSVSSWYTAFVLGLLKTSPAPFLVLLMIYLAIVICAVSGSQVMERLISRRQPATTSEPSH